MSCLFLFFFFLQVFPLQHRRIWNAEFNSEHEEEPVSPLLPELRNEEIKSPIQVPPCCPSKGDPVKTCQSRCRSTKLELVVVVCLWCRRGAAIVEDIKKKLWKCETPLINYRLLIRSFPHPLQLFQMTFGTFKATLESRAFLFQPVQFQLVAAKTCGKSCAGHFKQMCSWAYTLTGICNMNVSLSKLFRVFICKSWQTWNRKNREVHKVTLSLSVYQPIKKKKTNHEISWIPFPELYQVVPIRQYFLQQFSR